MNEIPVSSAPDAVGAETIRVLHVDDKAEFAEITATFLRREDERFSITTAADAAEGLNRLEEESVDCIVSDYDMPGRNGIEFLEAVREEHPELPFVLFTGKGSEEIASEAISAGVTDYLQKGTGTEQYTVLANRVQNAVDRVRAQRGQKRQVEAIETAQEGISILDDDGRYLYVNEAFADLHGYDPEELVGEHWELIYLDEDVPEVRADILPEVERTGYWHGETTSRRADGSTVRVDHTLAVTDRGELICTVRKTADRGGHEDTPRKPTARLEALFENSPDMINVHDTDGTIVDPNPRLCEKTGYDAETLTGMKVWELDEAITPEEARETWASMAVGDRRRLEGRYRRRDGSTFPVEVHLRRLRLAGEDRFVASSRDISDRKRRERRLQAQLEQFEHYGSVLSHDLRTPLRTVEGRIELAKETADLEHLDQAEAALERLDVLVDDLATVMREGKLVDELTTVDVEALVTDVWNTLPTGEMTLRMAGEARIRADTEAFTRMVENLLKNAVDHGGGTVTVGPLPDGLYIEDDGAGIPEDSREQVFELGYSTKSDDEGTGFGLASVRQIAVAHGWEIAATDGADGGVRFEVTNVTLAE